MQIVFFYLILAMTSLRQNSKENDRWRNIALNVSLFRLNDINATKAQHCCPRQQCNIWHDWNSAFVARDALNSRARNSQLRFVLQIGQNDALAVFLNQYLNVFLKHKIIGFLFEFLCFFSAPTCTGFAGCVSPQVLMNNPSSKTCGAATCTTAECCVAGTFFTLPFLSFPPFLLHCDQLFVFPFLHFLRVWWPD